MQSPPVPGLLYQDNILTPEFEREVIQWIDSQPWNPSLSRRTQHYGYEYNYTSKSAATVTTPISGPLLTLANYLRDNNVFAPPTAGATGAPEQCIVNEYTRSQGISAHTDSPSFGPTVVSFSLLQPCNMIFSRGSEKITTTLIPRSILIMSGEARSSWKHEIPGRVTVNMPDGSTYRKPEDYRRISLTYRTMA
jgi:alkylated DNA repair dioxygenase AlkB